MFSSVYAQDYSDREDAVRRCIRYYTGLMGVTKGNYYASANACYTYLDDDQERAERMRRCIRHYESMSAMTGGNYSASINACYEIR